VPLEVIQFPHPTLRHVSKPLKRVDAELRRWIDEMFELMYQHEGIGLAANQVDLPYRVFVINPTGKPEEKAAERVFINPVLSGGKGQDEAEEGCLSLPGIHAPVVRNSTIRVQAYDLQGNEIDEVLTGLPARVVMHETDHLDGVMFIDKLTPMQRAEILEDIEEFEIAFRSRQQSGERPSDSAIAARIAELEALRT
jgi:peptide deformylase